MNLNDTNARIDSIFGSVVDFSGAKLASVDFTGSDLSQAIFTSETQFSNGATGVNLNDTNARIDSIFGSVVDFSGAKLASVDFTGSDLSQAIFTSETQFSNGATGVNLNDTNARIDSIFGSVVDFSGAKLASVDFTGSDLSQAIFDNSKFDNSTVWPDGFDPIASGAINVDTNGGTNGNSSSIDDNNTAFIVSGGQATAPFYNITFESNGSVVDFQNYPLTRETPMFSRLEIYLAPTHLTSENLIIFHHNMPLGGLLIKIQQTTDKV